MPQGLTAFSGVRFGNDPAVLPPCQIPVRRLGRDDLGVTPLGGAPLSWPRRQAVALRRGGSTPLAKEACPLPGGRHAIDHRRIYCALRLLGGWTSASAKARLRLALLQVIAQGGRQASLGRVAIPRPRASAAVHNTNLLADRIIARVCTTAGGDALTVICNAHHVNDAGAEDTRQATALPQPLRMSGATSPAAIRSPYSPAPSPCESAQPTEWR